jgi:hypothetical protein
MALERDNTAERLARIDNLTPDMTPAPAQQQIARLQASLMVVSLPQGPSLDTREGSDLDAIFSKGDKP